MDNQELERQRKATIERTQDETTWGGPAGDILTGIRNAENAPSERAIWELVQNARDVSWEDEPAVISFVRNENGLQFSHYGKPFTNTSLESLIKQTSSKVRSDIKTVGKYGTGFLVTHQFGRIIHLSGLLQVVDGEDLYYPFPLLIIDRSFEDKDQLKGSLKRQASEANKWGFDVSKLTKEAHGKTQFEYFARFEAEKGSLQRAFDSAPNQAPYVLALNCQYIKEISFKDELQSKIRIFRLGDIVQKPVGEGSSYEFKRTDVEEIGERQKTYTIYSLSSKTIDSRVDDSNVTIVLPISECGLDGYQARLFEDNLAKLYLSLPLIGTEKWGLNLIIHSPLFECENDSRNGLRIVPQGLGLPENENKTMLDCAFEMVQEWLGNTLSGIADRKFLGKVCFDNTVKNVSIANYNEELQQKWTALYESQAIALNDQDEYIQPKDLYVVGAELADYAATDDELKEALYSIVSKTHTGNTPAKNDFLYWSKTLIEWRREELNEHILDIEQIVKALENLPEQLGDNYKTEELVNHILSITKYLIASGNEALLSYKIIPNEAGILHKITDLTIPVDFSKEFRSIIDDIAPEEKGKFIHPSFRNIGLSALGNYTEKEAKAAITAWLTDLQNTVSNKLKAVETDVRAGQYNAADEKWAEIIDDTVLNAVLRLYTMWIDRTADNMETKLHRLFSEYIGITKFCDERIGKEYFTDCEQMWRTLLFEIMYRFERLTEGDQLEKKSWVKDLVTVLKQYSSTEDYLKKATLYPDQSGKFHFVDELVSGQGILPEMKDYYDSIVSKEGETIKSRLVDDEFAEGMLNPSKWDNETVGGKIEEVVGKVDGYPNIQSYDKKAVVLQIVKRFSDDEEGKRWASYFKLLPIQKTSILVNFAESESVFKLLLQSESRLKRMSDLASREDCDSLLKYAEDEMERRMYEEADMKYKWDLGIYVERYLVEQLQHLLKDGETFKAVPDGDSIEDKDVQGGQDIIVYIKQGEDKLIPIYYVEVKSRWSTRDSVEMSKLQLEVSAREQSRYALCVVDMHDYDKDKVKNKEYPKEFSEIKDRISVVTNIGACNANLAPYISETSTEVHLGGEIKSVVPQSYVKNVCITFDGLLRIIEQKVREYYATRS